jgi:hypothetical protein
LNTLAETNAAAVLSFAAAAGPEAALGLDFLVAAFFGVLLIKDFFVTAI